MKDVYITRISKFLPNNPISNDEMEGVLGQINDKPSRAKRIVLRNNGIKERYYAMNSQGEITHTNAELTKEAIAKLFDDSFTQNSMELLCCGTSSPDQLLPSHASMVHGLLANKNLEINSASGICCAGMSSLKFGFLSVKSGNSNNAVCTGSERSSTRIRANMFKEEAVSLSSLEEQPIIAFKKDFLRWMLSDGAGAMLLENKKNKDGISLKVDWMEAYSYAHELETCMYSGGEKLADGSIKPWTEYNSKQWLEESIFSVKQDVKILEKHVINKGVESLELVFKKHAKDPSDIDYFLPHLSSNYFAEKLKAGIKEKGLQIPESSWFTNLDKVGNVGSASIYLMLEELMSSGKLKKGDKIMLSVPESGRFSYAYAHLTVC
ncbi:beta-ketoacyl-ACP synthase III [Flavivirga abyssicola]|uniref:beta-ketoacyl-ACP synthase III n=1 Tax=Flavivirga abyssicola TaxID=3063533 RepID=UPI0026DFB44F|nr:beta-ketoacyl-ACP synthase III [Flavivirga sp. MEBiC07777]WVK14979.1 beta-ketoacyl-ACP synthase III [Flavivirga sp. MEBiC07777]